MTTRAEMAAALSAVGGVTGFEFRPKAIRPGSAWPLIDDWDRGPGTAFGTTWRVIVIVSGDEKTASDKIEQLRDDVTTALEQQDAAYVFQARPARYETSGGEMFAVEILARSES